MFAVFSNTLSILNLVQLKILWLPKKVRATYNLGWTEYIERIRLLGFDWSSRKLCFLDFGVIYTKQLAPGRLNGCPPLMQLKCPRHYRLGSALGCAWKVPSSSRPYHLRHPSPPRPRPPSSPSAHTPGSCSSQPSTCPWASLRHLPCLWRHRRSPVSTCWWPRRHRRRSLRPCPLWQTSNRHTARAAARPPRAWVSSTPTFRSTFATPK
jgi:hypothetical protein